MARSLSDFNYNTNDWNKFWKTLKFLFLTELDMSDSEVVKKISADTLAERITDQMSKTEDILEREGVNDYTTVPDLIIRGKKDGQ